MDCLSQQKGKKYSRWESNPRSSPCKGDVITPRPRKLVMFVTWWLKFKLRKNIFYLSSVAIMKGVCFWVSHFVITDDRYDKEYTSQFCLDNNASTNCNYRWFAILGYKLTYSLIRNIQIYPKNSLILHASFFLSFDVSLSDPVMSESHPSYHTFIRVRLKRSLSSSYPTTN